MPIVKFSMVLIGLVVWFFNFLPTATAASLSVLTVCQRGQVGVVDASGRAHYIIDLVDNVTDGYSDTTPIDPRLGDWNKPAIFGVIHDFEAQYRFKADAAFSWVGYGFVAYLTLSQVEALQRDLRVVMITEDSQMPLPLLNLPLKADGIVVEYINTADFPNAPGGHYFYSVDPVEQATVDAGGAGHFVRTGRSFSTGGFMPVCRFYGSMSPGPNSHFFTASKIECTGLKAVQVTPRPTDTQQWNFEGDGFCSFLPQLDWHGQMECMAGTEPVYRAYNNAYQIDGGKNPWDSNHRYSTRSTDIDEMVPQGWRSEGIAFCVPIVVQ